MTDAVLSLQRVGLVRDGNAILDDIDWEVLPGERWIVLGPNGSGKTTLVRIAGLYLHPSAGEVEVLGQRLGRVDVRRHRARIGLVSAAVADMLRADVAAIDVVMTARHAALEPWWHTYEQDDRDRALALLDRMGCAPLAARRFGTLSSGERQRVLLARALMGDTGFLLLDEPAAGLDVAGREDLVSRLGALAADHTTPPIVLVTHHVDEIPRDFTHLLLLRAGHVHAAGPLATTLTAEHLSSCFDLALDVERRDGRWTARAVSPP